MNSKKSQEILKHITKDKDFGVSAISSLSLADAIYVLSDILPACIKEAEEKGNDNDAGYFNKMLDIYRPLIIDKIKSSERLWVVYCDSTGYPYELDGDMIVLFDYINHADIEMRLERTGFKVSLLEVNNEDFVNEVAHMYRNGYNRIRFMDGKSNPFIVEREELYLYEQFFNDDYMTNPGLQISMISFFQEIRKEKISLNKGDMLKAREDRMLENMINAEYMVPCAKTETDNEVEISHPFVDLTENIKPQDGSKVIAIPVFSDGFELNKCYEGQSETMLYTFKELQDLIKELGANGIVINCLGASYYVDDAMMKKILK